MTWIISTPTVFGYSVAVSDTRVTFGHEYDDCLQKIYEVFPGIGCGFAGWVPAGFLLKDRLTNFLYMEEQEKLQYGWEPDHIAKHFPEAARDAWNDCCALFPNVLPEKKMVAISVFMTHPNQNNGIPSMPKSYVLTFRAPNFEAEHTHMGSWISIGSGSVTHQDFISGLEASRFNPLFDFEIGNPGGYGKSIIHTIYMQMRDHPDVKVGGTLQTYIAKHTEGELLTHQVDFEERPWTSFSLSNKQQSSLCKSFDELSQLRDQKGATDADLSSAQC